jgi:hemerythrin
MIEWTKEFETGFPLLDAQHRKLFDMIAEMTVFLEAPAVDDGKIQEFVASLEKYAREHFECEERCMDQTGCLAREINLEAHRIFLDGVVRFKADFLGRGEKREFVAILQASLNAWLRNHILRVDSALRASKRT